jgi:hypothetical protein
MKLKTRIKRYPIESIVFAGFIITIACDTPHILQQLGASTELRNVAEANNHKNMQMKLTLQFAADSADIARQRYQTGCLVILDKTDKNQYASIVEGKPVKDRSDSLIPQNTIVCDGYGNTAIISLVKGIPVATQVAFTGDRVAISKARKFESAIYSSN